VLVQARALAVGAHNPDLARHVSGNRPSSTSILDDLGPRNIGRLFSESYLKLLFEFNR
jgi:glucose-6-phosphate isomerase